NGRRVLLPSPCPPDEQDLAPPGRLAPGEVVRIRYAGFLDTRRAAGRLRVRWSSPHRELGAIATAPLASEWTMLDVGPPGAPPPPPADELSRGVAEIVRGAWLWFKYYIDIVPRRLFCRAVLRQE